MQSRSLNPTRVPSGPSQVTLVFLPTPFPYPSPSPNPLIYPLTWVLPKNGVVVLGSRRKYTGVVCCRSLRLGFPQDLTVLLVFIQTPASTCWVCLVSIRHILPAHLLGMDPRLSSNCAPQRGLPPARAALTK